MATPVFCCGFECGVEGLTGQHWDFFGTVSFNTATVRSGSRSIRVNPTAATASAEHLQFVDGRIVVVRFYIRFATLPSASCYIFGCSAGVTPPGVYFNSSDNKLYAGTGTANIGATGVLITTGVWYRIDAKFITTANPWVIDVSVDGTVCGQHTRAIAAADMLQLLIGNAATSATADIFYDDFILSYTSDDYPIGAGYVNHFVPTADGTHNVAGANDFERSATGTDITNATTTAFQLIDDVPLKSGVVAEYINLIAPPNATDYVEVVFGPAPGISTPTIAPRTVEAIVAYASATAGTTNNLRIALNDNGSLDDTLNVTAASPGTTAVYARKHYADPPSAASSWTLSGNGNFNNIRMRCFTSDAAPDPWWASAMIEAEFQEIAVIPNKIVQIKQAVNRASTY